MTPAWLSNSAHRLATGVAAGFLAGLVAGGGGSRLAMRITAITAGSELQGALTEAEARVGEFTVGGSLFLILFGGGIGVIGGLMYIGLRPWIADAGRWRGLLFGIVVLATFGWTIIEGDNPDFPLFGSALLNVSMFVAIFIAYGLLLVWLFDLLGRVLVAPSFRRSSRFWVVPSDYSLRQLGSLALVGFSLFVTVQIAAAVAFGFGEESPTDTYIRFVGAYVLVVPGVASVLIGWGVGGFRGLSDLRHRPAVMLAATAVAAIPIVVGTILTAQALTDIFA